MCPKWEGPMFSSGLKKYEMIYIEDTSSINKILPNS